MHDPDEWLSSKQCAELAGITPATWRGYLQKGRAPKADDPDAETPQNRRRPRWRRSTVEYWRANRPGSGGDRRSVRAQEAAQRRS